MSNERAWLLALVLLTVTVRLPGVTRPMLGVFATKNVVYGMIARNFARGEAAWYQPTVDVLCGGERGWHLLEVPLSAYLAGGLWRTLGGSLDVWGRGVSIAGCAVAVAWLFAYVRRTQSQGVAAIAALTLAVSPVSIIFGQSFMLESSAVLFSIAAVDGFAHWKTGGRGRWLFVGGTALAAAVLTKVFLALLVLPILAGPIAGKRRVSTAAVAAIALLPALLWCGYVWNISAPEAPESSRIYYSLRASSGVHGQPWRTWLEPRFAVDVASDLPSVTLPPLGAILLVAGLFHRDRNTWLPWLGVSVLLVLLLPGKFQAMKYYWLVSLPPLCVLTGLGWEMLRQRYANPAWIRIALLGGSIACGIALAIRPAFVTPREDQDVLAAAEMVRRLVPQGERLVASHGSCPDLLYYCDRPGWAWDPARPDLHERLKEASRQGARKWVVVGEAHLAPNAAIDLRMMTQGHGFRIYELPAP